MVSIPGQRLLSEWLSDESLSSIARRDRGRPLHPASVILPRRFELLPRSCVTLPIWTECRLVDGDAVQSWITDDDPSVIVFARPESFVAALSHDVEHLPRREVGVLASWGVRLVLVSSASAAYVRQVQHQLQIADPFVCDGGAALHVPDGYLTGVTTSGICKGRWEIVRFNPPDRSAAVTIVRDLFIAREARDVLTIGIGCDLDDYGVLSAVDVPIVVRDPFKEQKELLRYVPGAYVTSATGRAGWSEALIGP